MSDYSEHYKAVNDLSEQGRRSHWYDFDHTIGSLLPDKVDLRVLDFGCGTGMLVEWLMEGRGIQDVEGVDLDEGQVSLAKSLGLPVKQVVEPFEWLAEQSVYDVIILKDVLEHVAANDDEKLLRAVRNSLAEDGVLILTVPNANSGFAARMHFNDPTHHRIYTEHTLRFHLLLAGFNDISIGHEDVWRPRSVKHFVRLVGKKLSRSFRRFSAIMEFGSEGLTMPLSLNLLASCRR